MTKDTNMIKNEPEDEKIVSKSKINKEVSENPEIDDKKFHVIENKSIQSKTIENIKNFISKIIEMQEKVKHDEEEEIEQKKLEEKELKKEEESNKNEPKYLLEYYDLPFRYNETVVKILAQTPKRLFVYWDISDKDRQTYVNAFGENFFNDTYPVLLVHNENRNYTSEVPINDFANSWYLDISNPRDKYIIQLGRKFKSYAIPKVEEVEVKDENITINNDYLFIAMSNMLEVPNDHILFEEFKPYVLYRNVKTKQEEIRNITTLISDNKLKTVYKKLYNKEVEDDKFDMLNPSSMGTSSSISFR